MAKVSVTRDLPVDAQTAWDNLADLESWGKWLKIHQAWKGELPTEVGVGVTFTEVVSVMGMANEIEWTVTQVDVPRSVTIAGTVMAGVKVEFRMSVTPTDSGSTVGIDADFSGAMIVGPIGKAVAKNAKADMEESLDTFAGVVAA